MFSYWKDKRKRSTENPETKAGSETGESEVPARLGKPAQQRAAGAAAWRGRSHQTHASAALSALPQKQTTLQTSDPFARGDTRITTTKLLLYLGKWGSAASLTPFRPLPPLWAAPGTACLHRRCSAPGPRHCWAQSTTQWVLGTVTVPESLPKSICLWGIKSLQPSWLHLPREVYQVWMVSQLCLPGKWESLLVPFANKTKL